MTDPDNLQQGIAAYKAGDKAKARALLFKAVREHPDDERAWGWLSNTAANTQERIHCLRQVVRINPANSAAAELLKELESREWLSAEPPNSAPESAAERPTSPAPAMNQPQDPFVQRERLYSIANVIGSVSYLLLFIGCAIICVVLFLVIIPLL